MRSIEINIAFIYVIEYHEEAVHKWYWSQNNDYDFFLKNTRPFYYQYTEADKCVFIAGPGVAEGFYGYNSGEKCLLKIEGKYQNAYLVILNMLFELEN